MIYVVRHGRTESNASGLLLGRANPPLDSLGRWQADQVAAALSPLNGVAIDRVVASPLVRAASTAGAIAAANGLDVEIDDRFIELDYGEWDQQPLGSVSPELWATWRSDDDFAPPGGESLNSLHARVSEGLDEVLAAAEDHNVVVVTHVSPIKSAMAWAMDVGIGVSWRMFVQPASITRIGTQIGRVSVHGFNDVSHLT